MKFVYDVYNKSESLCGLRFKGNQGPKAEFSIVFSIDGHDFSLLFDSEESLGRPTLRMQVGGKDEDYGDWHLHKLIELFGDGMKASPRSGNFEHTTRTHVRALERKCRQLCGSSARTSHGAADYGNGMSHVYNPDVQSYVSYWR